MLRKLANVANAFIAFLQFHLVAVFAVKQMCSEYEITMYAKRTENMWFTEQKKREATAAAAVAPFLIQKHACVEQIDNHTLEICILSNISICLVV